MYRFSCNIFSYNLHCILAFHEKLFVHFYFLGASLCHAQLSLQLLQFDEPHTKLLILDGQALVSPRHLAQRCGCLLLCLGENILRGAE